MRRANPPAKALRALEEPQSTSGHEYTILKISEPIYSAVSSSHEKDNNNRNNNDKNKNNGTAENTASRTSDVSTASLDAPTPASLEADLAHYKELFAKLRFSYVEQVTKEKFIRAIIGDPPLIVSPQENAELEASNAAAKAALKALKAEVAAMVADLESRGRDLARRYEEVRAGAALAAELPGKIAALEDKVEALRAAQQLQLRLGGAEDARPEMNLPLGKTLALVEERRRELARVERQLEVLGGQVPRKRKEVERLRAEVAALENRKANSAAAAREAKRRRENAQGGVEDELEARGRWYRASGMALRQVLDLQG
ncbi:0c8f443a-b2b0-46d9-bb4d-7be99b7d51ba [Thermothielavioides terrestris]|uniref:0c8f443a-b2b0-46d9-bb4d-7be99b7d51ba n=1 Tax=Thermothielavioides terrestris TaxID=2587410 RepID=A0A3S4B298_9PEZI|nr:0c8f443a-b2b0-46d9-bb4d-7be99b7d51ba [Thermothielavioides terrestris]